MRAYAGDADVDDRSERRGPSGQSDDEVGYTKHRDRYPASVTKHLVDIDDDALDHARAELGTTTIKDTVNEALRRTAENRPARLAAALNTLAAVDLEDRAAAWR